ncbi:MAG: UDP-N-acetylmuramoyl-L-alanine--D-glutamate ligase [Actinobacteria bacterium]|nr:UDP-N-acetylmuramoyl-L-alanine--D-glutamate ligase [Actinomycetota bacterium]
MGERAVVVGLGVTGRAVSRLLVAEGYEVVVTEDRPQPDAAAEAQELGVELLAAPGSSQLASVVQGAALVVPSPGVPAAHPVYGTAAAAGVSVLSEVELAWRRATVPMVAVTGTNGKTTVTTLVTEMLNASGVRAVAGGNIGLPLVEAVARDVDMVVAEVSSFQLQFTERFRPSVAVWLNFAEDHLDWHPTSEHYAAAKARIWANQTDDDLAVGNADDPTVLSMLAGAPARCTTFAVRAEADWRVVDGALTGPAPTGRLVDVDALPRSLPHDLSNSLAAVAAAVAAGADAEACAKALVDFRGLPHRVELVGDAGGVRFFDDSKATTPASVLAAVQGFDSVVLVAGGRNKGLDLGVLRQAAPRLRAVVAIGEAADEVAGAFAGVAPVTVATSMDDAVTRARAAAAPGDVVLLSPGCASFDWYRNYAERGDDFRRAVLEQVGE